MHCGDQRLYTWRSESRSLAKLYEEVAFWSELRSTAVLRGPPHYRHMIFSSKKIICITCFESSCFISRRILDPES